MTELRFGYHIGDLDHLTRSALKRGWGASIDQDLRYHLVWSAIAEAIYSATEAPEPGELVRIGWAAISDYLQTDRRHSGRRRPDGMYRPSFVLYWDEIARNSASPENGIVDRIALWQIWVRLRSDEQEALLALAVHDEYGRAANALGLEYNTYCARVRRGRLRFLRLWHEHEKPSQVWGRDRRGRHISRSGNDNVMGVMRRRNKDKTISQCEM